MKPRVTAHHEGKVLSISKETQPASRLALGSLHAGAALTLVTEVVSTLLMTYGPMAVAAREIARLDLP